MEKKRHNEGFKRHIVELNNNGQTISELARSYNLSKTTVSNWVKYYKNSGSFKVKDNLSEEEKRIKELEKINKEQQMEIDILKKAMVVMLKH